MSAPTPQSMSTPQIIPPPKPPRAKAQNRMVASASEQTSSKGKGARGARSCPRCLLTRFGNGAGLSPPSRLTLTFALTLVIVHDHQHYLHTPKLRKRHVLLLGTPQARIPRSHRQIITPKSWAYQLLVLAGHRFGSTTYCLWLRRERR